jgi:uncharacterized protein
MRDNFVCVFFGKTGAGKSSTLNKLFSLDLATDNAVACTKIAQEVLLPNSEYLNSFTQQVTIVDMPGIGESLDADEQYLPFYETWIKQAHCLVWVTQADTRAYKRDQIFLEKLLHLFPKDLYFIIALNKIDCLGVDEGEQGFNLDTQSPSIAQYQQIPEKIDDVYEIFKEVIGTRVIFRKDNIIPYTACYGWNLNNLKLNIFTRS